MPPALEDSGRVHPLLHREVLSKIKLWISKKELSTEFWKFFFVALFFEFGVAIFFFLNSLYLLDIGFRERQLGLIAGAMTFGGVTGTIPMGYLAKRIGLRRVLVAGFVITPLILAMRAIVVGERAQIGLAFLAGLCICNWAVCFGPATAKVTTEKNRTFAFSLLLSVGIGTGGLGSLAGGSLPGWLQSLNPSMHPVDAKRAVLLLCCGIYALGAWPASRLKLDGEQEMRGGPWRFDPFLLRFLPAVALWSFAAGAFAPFASAYLSRYVHISLAHIGMIFSASQLAQVVAVLFAPVVFRRFGLVVGIMYMQLIAAIALGGLARTHQLSLIVILYLSFSAFHWMSGPGIHSLLMNRVADGDRSSAAAANICVTSLCQAIASPLSGAAIADFGYPTVLTAISGLAILAALLFWALLREGYSGDSVVPVPAAN